MIVGFLNNQIDNRGTGNAVFDYAHYNEEILGNESKIFTFATGKHDSLAIERYLDRFGIINPIGDDAIHDVAVLYHIKSGEDDGFRPPRGIRYVAHGVFSYHPHGDRYAAVSRFLAGEHGVYVPHIINLPKTDGNFRDRYGIDEEASVFGRHGGADTFDIGFAWSAIRYILDNERNTWFLFLNTDGPDDLKNHPRVKFLSNTADPLEKTKFINTCDAMIHARSRGETFGIAVGEFAIRGKPVITYSESQETAHLDELGLLAFRYKTEEELIKEMQAVINGPMFWKHWRAYDRFTPKLVMKKFNEVFLS